MILTIIRQECPGYRDLFDALRRVDTLRETRDRRRPREKLQVKNHDALEDEDSNLDSDNLLGASSATPAPTRIAMILIEPPLDVEAHCLAYFMSNYVNTPRDPSTNVFIEHILPLYFQAAPNSALAHSVKAVAVDVSQMWICRYTDSYLSRKTYAQAVSLLKAALADPFESKSDDTLAAVFLLDFYDSLNKRFVDFIDTGTHQQGAMALLQHRGQENFRTPTSQRLFAALRSRHVNFALQNGQRVALSKDLLADDTAILPSAKLDLINAELANLHVTAPEGQDALAWSPIEFSKFILARAMAIDEKIESWRKSLPKSWQPVALPASDLHPSIREAGVYGETVYVYSSLAVSHVHNASLRTHVGALRLVANCLRDLEEGGAEPDLRIAAHLKMRLQEVIDRFCASVPYHLGNRTSLRFPSEPSEYPNVPQELWRLANYVDPFGNRVEMRQEDHLRAAAAIDGWFVLTPVAAFLKPPVCRSVSAHAEPLMRLIRPGQHEWVLSQTQRLQKIYGLPAKPFHL